MREVNYHEVQKLLKDPVSFYGLFIYTPLCGTCKAAERMLMVIEQIKPDLRLNKCDVNLMPQLAEQWRIQSVPCLLVFSEGRLIHRIFAMRSVQDLLQHLSQA